MVNLHGFLDEGDVLTSPARSGGHDTSFQHGDPQDGSDHDRDSQRNSEDESDENKVEEVEPSPYFSLMHAPPIHSEVRVGSEDLSSSKRRASTPLIASSVESCTDPK